MPWWIWITLGFGLLASETVVPIDFYLAFIGLAALVTGLVTAAAGVVPMWVQLVLFSGTAVTSLMFLRGPLIRRLGTGGRSDVGSERIVGDVAILMEDLPAGGVAKAELRGTVWSVRSVADELLSRGDRCRVLRVEGLTLWVSADKEN